MKSLFTLLLIGTCLNLSAQWSNANNQFYDSLHTPVCTAAGDQLKSFIVRSYPDSGYFIIWEDHRVYAQTRIFSQKYDKSGKRLWANDGVAISSATNNQHFTFPSNNDYRNYSVAATDSAGGFYIAYADDSVSNYVWERLIVQHMRTEGTTVFPGIGSVLFTSDQANQNLAPQLIADGNGGFFISHLHAGYGTMDLFVYCYKDINGTLKSYGGGLVSENGVQIYSTRYCVNYPTVVYPQSFVIDYNIYPDLQKGCNVVMEFSQNGYLPNGNNRIMLVYNWLWRAKKDSKTKVANYSKDDVVIFYKFSTQSGTLTCKDGSDDTVKLLSTGFLPISDWLYGAERTKGTIIQTDGNINVNVLAVNQRDVNGNEVTDWFTRAFYRKQQKFDSIPYEYTVDPYLPRSLNVINPPGQNKLGTYNVNLDDTILYNTGSSYFYDFSIASGGNKIFATGIMGNGARNVLLQQLQVQKITSDSFAVQLNTASKKGILIGKEIITSFGDSNINYNNPQVLVNNKGNGFFYILESGRYTRVSPIFKGAQLAWGAMGRITGTGYLHTSSYFDYTSNSTAIIDPVNGTGLISWNDLRTPPTSGNNIYMRHLDNLNDATYSPPNYPVKQFISIYVAATTAFPAMLVGSSKAFTTIDAHSYYSGKDITTPIAQILDNYNLGATSASVFDNNSGIVRTYNGHPYLDRNFTITPQNNPGGAATITVRLFFTQAQFEALKEADPGLTSPGGLAVIKQPSTGSAPAAYIFVAGEQTVVPQSWAAVPGGYYIEIAINSFSNFFIQKSIAILPLEWLDVQAEWINNQAKISWQVAQQFNVKDYTVQQSADGIHFANVYNVTASNSTMYNCTVPGVQNAVNYYRVLQTDNDGRSSFSNIVTLKSSSNQSIIIYPNPAKDLLYIRNDLNYRNVLITDLAGKVVLKKTISTGLNTIQIDQIPTGSYLITLTDGSKREVLKFVKD